MENPATKLVFLTGSNNKPLKLSAIELVALFKMFSRTRTPKTTLARTFGITPPTLDYYLANREEIERLVRQSKRERGAFTKK